MRNIYGDMRLEPYRVVVIRRRRRVWRILNIVTPFSMFDVSPWRRTFDRCFEKR